MENVCVNITTKTADKIAIAIKEAMKKASNNKLDYITKEDIQEYLDIKYMDVKYMDHWHEHYAKINDLVIGYSSDYKKLYFKTGGSYVKNDEERRD